MKKTKKLVTALTLCASFLYALSAGYANAITKWTSPPPPSGDLPQNFDIAIMNLTNWILGFVSMVSVLALIWGGVMYLTSVGNEDRARTGKQVITYALMGLIIAGISYAIVNTVVTVILG